jgi:hypothetical protein
MKDDYEFVIFFWIVLQDVACFGREYLDAFLRIVSRPG